MEEAKKTDTYSLRVTPELVESLKETAAKYPSKIDFANDIIVRLNADAADDSEKDNIIQSLTQQIEALENRVNQQNSDYLLVPVTPFRRKCLNYLLERERKYLGVGEELNEATVYNYILDEILIKGNKFSIKSIPDSKIEQFKSEVDV